MPSAIRVHCHSDVDLPTANHTLHFGRFCAPGSITNYYIVQLGRITLIGEGPDEEWNPSDRRRDIAGLAATPKLVASALMILRGGVQEISGFLYVRYDSTTPIDLRVSLRPLEYVNHKLGSGVDVSTQISFAITAGVSANG